MDHPPERSDPVGPSEDPDAWLASLRADATIGERSREGWLRQQAREEATLAGVLLDLAEQGRPVRVSVPGGDEHRGRISAVGTDVVVLAAPGATTVVLPMASVAAVRAVPSTGTGDRTGDLAGDRAPVVRTDLHELLHRWVPDRPEVTLHLGAARLHGELAAAGADVVTVREEGRRPVVVALRHIDALVTRERVPPG